MSPKGLKAIPKDVFRFKPKSSHSRALSVFYYFIKKKIIVIYKVEVRKKGRLKWIGE